MHFSVRLPLSDITVILSIKNNTLFDQKSIPPVFKPFDNYRTGSFGKTYTIDLTMTSVSSQQPGRLILNFRDVVFIYEIDMRLYVELAETTADELWVLANMGISIALCQILCRENIFPLHAASVVRDGKGFIFPGRSDSGKTTISRLSAVENEVLCDELTAVTTRKSNSDNTSGNNYSIFPGPEWAKFTFVPEYYCDTAWRDESHGTYPLKAVIFPSRSGLRDETWLERVDSIDAALNLMMRFTDTAFVKALPAETHRIAFHFFSQLARSVPCYTIHANIQTDIWKVIDETIEQ